MAFIPYQVDYSMKNTAKTLGFSKKRVSFKFGFASQQSLDQGLTGPQCRGSEHEVTFLWSLKSGKRQLYLDGKDVHYSESGQNGWTADRAWQHTFPLRDMATGRSYKCHFISQPVNKDISFDMKPFDLRINGVSYFSFNEIWKLGTPAMISRDGPRSYGGGGGSGGDAHLSAEERRLIALAKVESLKEYEREKAHASGGGAPPKKMAREEEALISFDDPPPPAQIGSVATSSTGTGPPPPPNPYSQYASSLTLDPAIADGGRGYSGSSYGQPPAPPNPYGAPPPPVPAYSPYGAPAPAASATAMTPYTAGPAPSPYAVQPPAPVQTYGYGNSGNSNAATAGVSAGFNALTSPSGQSYASYGSAPSFARPPPSQPTPSPQGVGMTPGYGGGYPGQPPAPGGGGGGGGNYGAPPPQQQQQYPLQPYAQPRTDIRISPPTNNTKGTTAERPISSSVFRPAIPRL